MSRYAYIGALIGGALSLSSLTALAQERGGDHQDHPERAAPMQGDRDHAPGPAEHYEGPRGYTRPEEPKGWNQRPATVDRKTYQHNFDAPRKYHVGPYHAPPGWSYRRWGYGQILPRAYWASEYFLSDYWLFGLEVPPTGYEWVRNGDDALLVDTNSGEILQVEYGVFV